MTQQRRQVLQAASHSYLERFVKGLPHLPAIPTEVWINSPIVTAPTQSLRH